MSDVGQGSYDGAEECELIGLYILSLLLYLNLLLGLYRDDGLTVGDLTPRQMELVKKDICKIFQKLELKITIVT